MMKGSKDSNTQTENHKRRKINEKGDFIQIEIKSNDLGGVRKALSDYSWNLIDNDKDKRALKTKYLLTIPKDKLISKVILFVKKIAKVVERDDYEDALACLYGWADLQSESERDWAIDSKYLAQEKNRRSLVDYIDRFFSPEAIVEYIMDQLKGMKDIHQSTQEEFNALSLVGVTYQWGFALPKFKDGVFQAVLQELGIPLKVKLVQVGTSEFKYFLWKGNGVELITHGNPMTGEFRNEVPGIRKYRLGFVRFMGLRSGNKEKLEEAVRLVQRYGRPKDESKNELGFIGFP